MRNSIVIKGAMEHNLKSFDASIPSDTVIGITSPIESTISGIRRSILMLKRVKMK